MSVIVQSLSVYAGDPLNYREPPLWKVRGRLLPVILMMVQEAGYLSLELGHLLQIPDGTGIFEQFPLDLLGESVPPHDHRGPEAPQDLLLVRAINLLRRRHGLIVIACQPFFVCGQRRTVPLQGAELPGFAG